MLVAVSPEVPVLELTEVEASPSVVNHRRSASRSATVEALPSVIWVQALARRGGMRGFFAGLLGCAIVLCVGNSVLLMDRTAHHPSLGTFATTTAV